MRPLPVPPPHPDLLALLDACRSAPADDTPRLVLADWLDDNADTAGLPTSDDARNRAALIRVQVELARPTLDTARVVQLRAAEAQLLATNAARWLGDLPHRLDQLRRRPFGFAANVPNAGPPVFDFDPLSAHNLWRFHRGLLTVELAQEELPDLELGAWFASPQAAWVEEASVSLSGARELERLKVPDALRPYLGIQYELGTPPQRTLRLVTPRSDVLTRKLCKRLLKCANFAFVRSLTLHTSAVEVGVLALLTEADVTGVRRLPVKTPIGDKGAAFLAAASLVNLSSLDVSGCEIGADGMRLLANSLHLRQLASLTAYRNLFGCDGVAALAASPLADRLNVLDLQNTALGDRGVAALAASPLLNRLNGPGLNLSLNPIGDPGATALAACPHLERFTELVLRDCRIGDTGAAALAGSAHLANLAYLDLWKNRLGDAGAKALAASKHLVDVRDLSLRDNLITPTGAKALQKRFADRVKV